MENMFKLIALTLAVSLGAGSLNAAATALGATTAATPLSEADNTLLKAVRRNNLAGVVAALDRGANVNAADNDGTALYLAAFSGNIEIVRLLLAKPEIKVNAAKRGNGWTALHRAVYSK